MSDPQRAPGPPGGDLKDAVRRKGSIVNTFKAVAWSFFGVRNSAAYARDLEQINPVHIVIAGLVAVAVFIGLLIGLVRWVIGSGMAT
jgi:hypothetical protein